MKRISRWPLLALGVTTIFAGCNRAPEEPYREFAKITAPTAPAEGSTDPYQQLELLGLNVLLELKEPSEATYTPGYRENATIKLAKQIQRAMELSKQDLKPRVQVRPIGSVYQPEAGIARLGRVISWTIDLLLREGKFEEAAALCAGAQSLGAALTAGDAVQAQAGLAIMDFARNEWADHLAEAPPEVLLKLSKTFELASSKLSPVEVVINHEKQNYLVVIQQVQDVYRNRKEAKTSAIETAGQQSTRETWQYLRRMPESERPKYFNGFAAELDQLISKAIAESKITPAARKENALAEEAKAKKENQQPYRPWRRLIPHFLATHVPYQQQYDLTLARTRIAAVTAWAHAQTKQNKVAPADLSSWKPESIIDPYSLRQIGYASASGEFKVYAIGVDGRDDAGDSDDGGVSPDVILFGTAMAGS